MENDLKIACRIVKAVQDLRETFCEYGVDVKEIRLGEGQFYSFVYQITDGAMPKDFRLFGISFGEEGWNE